MEQECAKNSKKAFGCLGQTGPCGIPSAIAQKGWPNPRKSGADIPAEQKRYLITGATGTLGREVLWDILEEGFNAVCVVRGRDRKDAEGRMVKIFSARHELDMELSQKKISFEEYLEKGQCVIYNGDLSLPNLGLSDDIVEELVNTVTGITHGAANVNFNESIDSARTTNVEGTRNVMNFALRIPKERLERIDHVSTAYIAGKRPGSIKEDDVDVGQLFNNTYEHTKCEAELLVRQYWDRLPITVVRPSIIAGDSRTGYTSSFKVLYWPLKMFSKGFVVVAPANPKGMLDIVPMDYVVNAMRHLRHNPRSIGRTVHLAAGPHALSIRECCASASRIFHTRVPIFLNPTIFKNVARPILFLACRYKNIPAKRLTAGDVYWPYVKHLACFDISARDELIDPSVCSPPDVRDYFESIMRFAHESQWGRKDITKVSTAEKRNSGETDSIVDHTPQLRAAADNGGAAAAGALPPLSVGQ